jgi:hypothetical protein
MVQPKRHWFLALYRDRRRRTYYVYDRLVFAEVAGGLTTLEQGRKELSRLKHLPQYREVAAQYYPPVPWNRTKPEFGRELAARPEPASPLEVALRASIEMVRRRKVEVRNSSVPF